MMHTLRTDLPAFRRRALLRETLSRVEFFTPLWPHGGHPLIHRIISSLDG
jgi:hypothetical protein